MSTRVNLVMSQDKKPRDKNKFRFYILALNDWEIKLKNYIIH